MFVQLFVILLSTIAVFSAFYFHIPIRVLQQINVLITVICIIFANMYYYKPLRRHIGRFLALPLLFLTSILVPLIVMTTGGLNSPFVILIHLFVLVLSFQFSFLLAMFFMMLTLSLLFSVSFLFPAMGLLIQEDTITYILYIISFATIIPLSYLLVTQYRFKDALSRVLANQLHVQEMILEDVNEMIFITDMDTKILSVNDAVEQMLNRSRVELLHKQLFDLVLLKDKYGKLLTKEGLQIPELKRDKLPKLLSDMLLVNSNDVSRYVSILIRPIVNVEGLIDQMTIVVERKKADDMPHQTAQMDIQRAQVQHDAVVEEVKRQLQQNGNHSLALRLRLVQEAEQDIQNIHIFQEHQRAESRVRVDLAELCRQTVEAQKELATPLRVPLQFEILHFTLEDIKPLVTSVIHVTPEQFTGPFFTAPCDPKLIGIILSKLIHISILLSSTASQPNVSVTIERVGKDSLVITTTANSPAVSVDDYADIFTPYYGHIGNLTNLQYGSGLEGYLAKTIADKTSLNLQAHFTTQPYQLICSLTIAKS